MNSREIKFRARGIATGQWYYGYYSVDRDGRPIITELKTDDDGVLQIIFVDYKTVGQFTGLKDKNGKEIYEGDGVAVFDGEEQTGLYEVEYCDSRNYPAFDFKGWDGETNGLCEAIEVFSLEVLGNIYENPKLRQ